MQYSSKKYFLCIIVSKEYLEEEVFPSIMEGMRQMVGDIKTDCLVSFKYSKKDGLSLETVEMLQDEARKAETEKTIPDIDDDEVFSAELIRGIG